MVDLIVNLYLDRPEKKRSLPHQRLPWRWPQHRPSSSTPFPWLLQLVSVRYPSLCANMSSAWFAQPLTRVTHWILGPWQQLWARMCERVSVCVFEYKLYVFNFSFQAAQQDRWLVCGSTSNSQAEKAVVPKRLKKRQTRTRSAPKQYTALSMSMTSDQQVQRLQFQT